MHILIYRINGAKFRREFGTETDLERYAALLIENGVEIIGRKSK